MWVAENRKVLGLECENDESEELEQYERRAGKYLGKDLSKKDWQGLLKTLEDRSSTLSSGEGAWEDLTAKRLRQLGKAMDFASDDVAILEILMWSRTQPIFESLIESVFEFTTSRHIRPSLFNVTNPLLPRVLGVSGGVLRARLATDAPLLRSGLVSIDDDGDIEIVKRLNRLVTVTDEGELDMRRPLLDTAPPGELEWEDFDHVAEQRDHIEKVLKGALSSRAKGVNILVYGPPGTGKTEFCKTLAARLQANLYSVGEADDSGDEPRRGERLQELQVAQNLLAPGGGSMLLFDEMEDLLSDPGSGWIPFSSHGFSPLRSGGSKVFLNRLLERTPVPTLWTSNSARETCPTVLRRMTCALELRRPTRRTRARIWSRELARHGIEATEEDGQSLAKEFDVAPGVASGAIAAASLCGEDLAAVRLGVQNLSRVISGEKPMQQGAPERFDPALIRADVDPVGFTERLEKTGGKHFSLCLQGPPGTGKSAFVRYLAERLGLQVTQKRASDLMSMWVGQTERLIADAFAEARAEGSILVFDEADSLLADRRGAVRSWEVSQVNEMLTWMESHPLPFACTTNFGETLDPATLRRFTFKIALDYLTPSQSMAGFRNYFESEAPAEVETLTNLTPGDFAVVRRKAEILGHLQDPKVLGTGGRDVPLSQNPLRLRNRFVCQPPRNLSPRAGYSSGQGSSPGKLRVSPPIQGRTRRRRCTSTSRTEGRCSLTLPMRSRWQSIRGASALNRLIACMVTPVLLEQSISSRLRMRTSCPPPWPRVPGSNCSYSSSL